MDFRVYLNLSGFSVSMFFAAIANETNFLLFRKYFIKFFFNRRVCTGKFDSRFDHILNQKWFENLHSRIRLENS